MPPTDCPLACVYLLQHPSAGLFKIGRSACPERRVGDVSTAVGGLCEVLHMIQADDAARLEAELHRVYQQRRVAGSEWFLLSAEHVAEVRAMTEVRYATLAKTKQPRRGVYRISLPGAVADRLETTAATLGIRGASLARKVVTDCLPVFERRAAKRAERKAADESWNHN